jgi:CrcB protein
MKAPRFVSVLPQGMGFPLITALGADDSYRCDARWESVQMKMILMVAFGGALGSVARHLVAGRMTALLGSDFPWGILTVNFTGGVVMGTLIELLALRWSVSPQITAFLTVGILGGYTTFSSFSLDTVVLIERGHYGLASSYIIASVCLAVGGLMSAMTVTRWILA